MKRKIIIAITISLMLTYACTKVERLGPIIRPATITKPLSINKYTADFAAGDKIYFYAELDQEAEWIITIKGKTTGARYTIKGVSNIIDASNAVWEGYADVLPSFKQEEAVATLTLPNNPNQISKDSLTIITLKNLDAGGIIVSDFEHYNPAWASDWPPTINTNTAYNPPPDGNNYLHMSGTAWQGNPITPYVDYLTITAAQSDVNYGTYFPLSIDPTKIYFNIMVYNTGTKTNLRIALMENGSAVRGINIRPDWVGWKLISVNYTQFIPDAGVTTQNPDKITGVQFVLLSDNQPPQSAAVSAAFDHVIFTLNGPYRP
ncbi:MAG: hypothetical protein NZ529_11580 [Cytophagaceae bacterium]|nr:hypothetical protein [Cytophagaceae bacterium]MDW8457425.1 hypothetical protein [Cytophagaceae bacterium]